MKVRFTPSARTQFLSALAYILRDKPSAAISFRNLAESVLKRLEDFPESARVIPESTALSFKEVIISPYRFFIKFRVKWSGSLGYGMASKSRINHCLNAQGIRIDRILMKRIL